MVRAGVGRSGAGCVRPRHPTSLAARSVRRFLGLSLVCSGTELGCRAPQEPCYTGPAQLTQPLLCSMWAVLSAVAPGHRGHDYLFGNSGFYLKYLPCSFIYYFFFVMSYHCIALQAAVKNFFSFTDLSLPFRFSGFYLHRGDP